MSSGKYEGKQLEVNQSQPVQNEPSARRYSASLLDKSKSDAGLPVATATESSDCGFLNPTAPSKDDAEQEQLQSIQNPSVNTEEQVHERIAAAKIAKKPRTDAEKQLPDTSATGSSGANEAHPYPKGLLLTFEICSCVICFKKLAVGEGVVLQDCFCSFCRACLTAVVEKSSTLEVMCPLSSNCGGRILQREIKALVLPNVYDLYTMRVESKIKTMMSNIFYCKTKGCNGCCEYLPGSAIFLCNDCNKSNCLSCEAIHESLTCEEFAWMARCIKGSGKSLEEFEKFISTQLPYGWDQVLGTVTQWIENSPEKKVQYSQILQKMTNQDLWVSVRIFKCPVCLDFIPIGNGIIIQDCLHCICRECSACLVENATGPEVKCPHQENGKSCKSFLSPREIKALVTPEAHEIFLNRSVQQAEGAIENSFHCNTPDCQGWCEFEKGAVFFHCQVCSKKNCLACKAIHENLSCVEYKSSTQNANEQSSEKMIQKLIKKGACMRCPSCKTLTMKVEGCDWISCNVCKCEICWATKGPRWGPKGAGDTSGGCKCKADGVTLCTPKCRNCH